MEILGYISAIIIGMTLGLIGGGGSILTVPVFVYFFGFNAVSATAYSLVVVGLTSLVGAVSYIKRGEVSYKTSLVFAVPAFIGVYLTRRFIVPSIPEIIFESEWLIVSKDVLIMLLFAFLMVASAISMIRARKSDIENDQIRFNYPLIFAEGIIVGLLTGLVGAGGGFLIIPALVLLANLPMKLAVGTSLLIIAAKSLIGFIGDINSGLSVDWEFLMIFSLVAAVGIIAGSYSSSKIDSAKLKPLFGWFVMVIGVFIIVKELV